MSFQKPSLQAVGADACPECRKLYLYLKEKDREWEVEKARLRDLYQILIAKAATYSVSNLTTSRTFDADTVTTAELADIVGTMLADMGWSS